MIKASQWIPLYRKKMHKLSLADSVQVKTEINSVLKNLPTSAYSALVVNLEASAANYQILCDTAGKAECSAVLKADGYGLGAVQIALRLHREGCRSFFVAFADEGVEMRQAFAQRGIEGDIYVLNGMFPGAENIFTEYHLIPVLTDLDQITRWRLHGHVVGEVLPAAIHVDTGMTRTGLPSKELMTIAQSPELLKGLKVKLVLSQMVYSHDENMAFSGQQRQRFEQAIRIIPHEKASLAKSGVIFLGGDYQYDMVRPGIALHGINPTNDKTNPLQPVVSLWARIYQVQDVVVGQSIGYSQTFIANAPRKVATLGIGYADGYPWALANKGFVMIGEHRAPIVGRVSMDLLTVDVTDVPEHLLYHGAWVQLIGDPITVERVAEASNTIPYEIILGLGKRFHRVYTS